MELGPGGVNNRSNRSPEDKISSDCRLMFFYSNTMLHITLHVVFELIYFSDVTGQIPGSPRIPPFPNLPDMSPKKVSAVHNVYVSPLRSTKVCSFVQSSCQFHCYPLKSSHVSSLFSEKPCCFRG